jgi:MFS family permease
MCGALFIWMTDWYGRTWHIFFGCLGVCIGTIVTSLSTTLPMFIAGRFLLSFFATCAHTAAPLYLVELAPAAYRGTIAGMYNTFYNVVGFAYVLLSGSTLLITGYYRALCLRLHQCMLVTNISPTKVTLTGGFRFGFKWSAQGWLFF